MVGVTELRKREVAIFLSQLALYLCRFDRPALIKAPRDQFAHDL
jgi:hypothetical protein